MSFSLYSILVQLSLFLVSIQVAESSRPLLHYNKISNTHSVDQLKIVKVYSGPRNEKSGTTHHFSMMHNHNVRVRVHIQTKTYGFKIRRGYSGPSRKGSGHGLTNLLLNNSSSTPFKSFNAATYPGPSSRGTGH